MALSHTAMTLRNVSADLAETEWGDVHAHLLAQQLDQHHGSALTIGHLVNALDASERHFGQAHPFAGFKQPLRFALPGCLQRPWHLN